MCRYMYKEFYIKRKHIGTLNGDTFSKDVLVSRHLFRVLDAWGMDSKTLHSLPKGSKIVFKSIEEGKWYQTTKEDFLELGTQYLHFKTPHEDYRAQLFLKREYWKIEAPRQLTKEQQEENAYRIASGIEPKWV